MLRVVQLRTSSTLLHQLCCSGRREGVRIHDTGWSHSEATHSEGEEATATAAALPVAYADRATGRGDPVGGLP